MGRRQKNSEIIVVISQSVHSVHLGPNSAFDEFIGPARITSGLVHQGTKA